MTAPEKTVNITIEAGPHGITVRAEYTGSLSSIPAAIERLKAAGVLDLVNASAPQAQPQAPADKPKRPAHRVEPEYDADGEPCCPVHNRPLKEGKWGLFCSAKDQESGEYCKLKFNV